MIDFSAVRKFVYFPRNYERETSPYVVHVLGKWGTMWRGHVRLDKLLAKEFNYFAINRCQPYSDALWEKCRQWTRKRDDLEAEYLHLMVNGGNE